MPELKDKRRVVRWIIDLAERRKPVPFGIKHDLRLAVAIAEVDEHDAALIAVRIDPAAKRDFLADLLRAKLAASMSAKQSRTPRRYP